MESDQDVDYPLVAEPVVDHWLSGEFPGGNSGRKVAQIEDLDQREGAARG